MISPTNLSNALTALHLAIGGVLLYDPNLITSQQMVFLVGEAMGMPPAPAGFSGSSGLSGLLFIILGATDMLVQTSPHAHFKREYWRIQAPFRCMFFMGLMAYSYLSKPAKRAWASGYWAVNNRVVFTWSFIELLGWYFVFSELKEEGKRLAEEKKAKEREGEGED